MNLNRRTSAAAENRRISNYEVKYHPIPTPAFPRYSLMKTRTLLLFILAISNHLLAQPDTAKYQVYINKAMAPGNFYSYNRRIYLIEEGEVKVLNLVKTIGDHTFKNIFKPDSLKDTNKYEIIHIYDTTKYKMNLADERLVRQTLYSIKCLDNFMHDPGWIVGLRFIFTCKIDTYQFNT